VSHETCALTTIQWVSTGYLLAMAAVIPLTGWSLERFDARTVWMFCIGAFLAGSLLCGIAWSAGSLVAFRVVQGIGGGMILPLGQGVIAQAAGPNRLGRVMAAIGIPTALGPVLGPVLGGLFVTDASWRWIFYINVPVCLAALAFSWRIMPTAKAAGRSPLDVLGLVLLSPAFGAIVYGLAEAGKHGGFGQGTTVVPLGVGAALLVAFVVHALRTKAAPIIDLRLFQVRSFATSSAVVFLAGTVLFGAMGALPLYFQQTRGYTALHIGLLLVPMGVGMGVSLVAAGRLTDRLPPRPIVLVGLVLAGAASLVYTQLGAHTSPLLIGATLVASGAGVGAVLVPVMAAAMRDLHRQAIPKATTASRIFLQLGSSLGAAVVLIVLSRQITDRSTPAGQLSTADLAAAFGHTFWWILAFAALPALLLPSKAPAPGSPATPQQGRSIPQSAS
jgi:EmrB/QacA subfamily drug resistance transporter